MAQAWDKGNITSSHPSSRITSGSHGDGSHGMVKKKKKNTLRSERSEGKLSRQMTSVTPAIVSDDDLDISIRSGIHHTHTHTHNVMYYVVHDIIRRSWRVHYITKKSS